MKSFRHKCAVIALLSAGLAGPASAQLNPYGLPASYPSTNQYPATNATVLTHYQNTAAGRQAFAAETGPILSPANQVPAQMPNSLTSLISSPPAASPVEPIPAPPEMASPSAASAYGGAGAAYGSLGSGSAYGGMGYGSTGHGAAGMGGAGYGSAGYGGGAAGCGVGGGVVYGPPGALSGGFGWFASASGLIMTRDRNDHHTFSFVRANEADQRTDAHDASIDWGGGFDIRVGHYFNCGQNAIQGVYWGWYPQTSEVVSATDGVIQLDTILNFDQLDYLGGPANLLTDDAQIHTLHRDNEVHNVELNFLQLFGGGFGGLRYNVLAGARYFKFRDHLLFSADTVDRVLTGAPQEVTYDIDLDNNLIGFQVGGEAQYCVSSRLKFDVGTKLGLFGNHIEHFSRIGGAAGTAVINNGPNNGRAFLVDNNKNDVAFLAEINFGGEYCLTECWTLIGGYRAVAVTGVALPTDQIYPDLRGIQDVEQVASNGSLILHGAYIGAEFNY